MSSLKRRMKETVLKAAYPVAVRIPPTVGPAKVRRLNARMRVSKALRLIRQKQDYAKAEAIAQPLIGTQPYVHTAVPPPPVCSATVVDHVADLDSPRPEISRA